MIENKSTNLSTQKGRKININPKKKERYNKDKCRKNI